ncbi:MAG: OmpH family outer membrane protein [Sphingomonadales bacterium]
MEKNGMIVWNVLLTILGVWLLSQQLGTKGALRVNGKPGNIASAGSFKMAYFEMDSVAANFELVKVLKSEMLKREESINTEMDRLARNMQQKYNYYQEQANTGVMNQAQSEEAGRDMKKLDDQIKNRKQALDAEYGDFVMRRQNDIKLKIEAFLAEYNQSHQFSYIISYEPGLFYYKDKAYDITSDLVKGLNEKYKK